MTRECGALYLKEKRYRLLLKLWEKEREAAEERFNPNHDPKTGRFTSGGVDKSAGSGIIGLEKDGTAGNDVHYVGKIDKKIYSCVTEDIVTDEVIITDERIQHIKDRHPGDYQDIAPFLEEALKCPDYILEETEHKNTGLILKQVEKNRLRFQMVLKIHTSVANPEFKNSILSAWRIGKKRWESYINNKKILYKLE